MNFDRIAKEQNKKETFSLVIVTDVLGSNTALTSGHWQRHLSLLVHNSTLPVFVSSWGFNTYKWLLELEQAVVETKVAIRPISTRGFEGMLRQKNLKFKNTLKCNFQHSGYQKECCL